MVCGSLSVDSNTNRPIGSQGVRLQQDAVTLALIVTGSPGVIVPVDVTDRWARQLGQIDLARVLGAALAAANPVIVGIYDAAGNRMPPMDVAARPGFVDVIDRVLRQLGVVTIANLDVLLSTRASEVTLIRIVPVAKASVFNTALPLAEADWLGAAIVPTNSPSYLRIYVCVTVSGVLRVARTVGGVTVTENLNDGVALVANSAYMFTVEWRTGDSINLRYSVTGGVINIIRADEIGAAE